MEKLGITETKKKEGGMARIRKEQWLFWSGVDQTEEAKKRGRINSNQQIS